MVNSPLIRPAIYWGGGSLGGVTSDSHETILQESMVKIDESQHVFPRVEINQDVDPPKFRRNLSTLKRCPIYFNRKYSQLPTIDFLGDIRGPFSGG